MIDSNIVFLRFTVIAREGAKVVVRSDRGVQYSRNVQDVKKLPENLEHESEQVINQELHENDQGLFQTPGDSHQQGEDLNEPEAENPVLQFESVEECVGSNAISTRPQRMIRKPNRFKDMILFSIFE